MLLPKHLQRFADGALIVAADSVLVRCWFAAGDSLEELDGLVMPKETGQDGEGSFEFFPDDRARLNTFAKRLAAHITQLERKHKLPHIHLVMPAEVEHLVSKQLPLDVADKVSKIIHHDVIKEHPLDIVTRLIPSALP